MAITSQVVDFRLPQDSERNTEVDFRLAAGVFRGYDGYVDYLFTLGIVRSLLVLLFSFGAFVVAMRNGQRDWATPPLIAAVCYFAIDMAASIVEANRAARVAQRAADRLTADKEEQR